MRKPILILSASLGTPQNVGVTKNFRPFLGPQEGKGEALTFGFVPFCWHRKNVTFTQLFRRLVGPREGMG